MNKAGARFDWDKLNWLNSQVLHERGPEQPAARAAAPLERPGLEQPTGRRGQLAPGSELCALIGPSLVTLQDGIEQARPFFERPEL